MSLSAAETAGEDSPPRLDEEINSECSTPFVSAPSSPTNGPSCYFFSAPASPMHYLLTKESHANLSPVDLEPVFLSSDAGSFEFEFSSRFSPGENGGTGSMTSADELFCNGQIRPMKLSFHLQRPQEVADVKNQVLAGSRGRDLWPPYGGSKYFHRKTRSMSPFRSGAATNEWPALREIEAADVVSAAKENESIETTPSCSASSSRSSSSSGRNSKKWMFLKDLLRRSKSEGTATANSKDKFWSSISFSSSAKEKKSTPPSPALSRSSSREDKRPKTTELTIKARNSSASGSRPTNGVWRRRIPPSAHELHYTANRAQAEEMRKKTFLPYRQGLLACLGFNSKSYGAFNGFTKTLNPISSR